MEYIKVKNKGLMNVKALTLVGASTKVGDDSKIGQFGSGNKYAMAYLLRNGYDPRIFSGKKEIKLATKVMMFRGSKFNIITVNGAESSITTEMGKDWELWQAMRELYCNALDESEGTLDIVDKIEATAGETHFYIKLRKDAVQFMKNFDNYFATNKKVLYECEYGKILEKSSEYVNIYYKGIKCNKGNKASLYDYDFNQIRIDENRIHSYYWEPEESMWRTILSCDNVEIIKDVLYSISKNTYEGDISECCNINKKYLSDTFKNCVKGMKLAPHGYAGLLKPDEVHMYTIIPTKLFNILRPHLSDNNVADSFKFGGNVAYRDIEDPLLQGVVDLALGFLKKSDFFVPYVINIGIFANKDIMGCADGETIVLSDICLEKGVTEVVNTIIEEFIHIKYEARDCSRDFQTSIITEMVSYMKKFNVTSK